MSIYLINTVNQDLAKVTRHDLSLQNIKEEILEVDLVGSPLAQIEQLSFLPLNDGDIICMSGMILRPMTWEFRNIANESNKNLMPGRMVDHRSVTIPLGSFFSRKPQDENGYAGVPHVMILGDAAAAKESWNTIASLDIDKVWSRYKPEVITTAHWLSAAASLHDSWLAPDWFPVVDMSVRDLEIAPVMYATNHWSDWIAFYPSNGFFKLENHAQLYPVWLDNSTKPLEYWNV